MSGRIERRRRRGEEVEAVIVEEREDVDFAEIGLLLTEMGIFSDHHWHNRRRSSRVLRHEPRLS